MDLKEIIAKAKAKKEGEAITEQTNETPSNIDQSSPRLMTMDDLRSLYKDILEKKVTLEDYQRDFEHFCLCRDSIIKGLEVYKVVELQKMAGRKDLGRKTEYCRTIVDGLLAACVPKDGIQFEPMSEKYHDAMLRIVKSSTLKDLHDYADHCMKRIEDMRELRRQIRKPETLNDFEVASRYRRLNEEERQRYNELKAEVTLSQKEEVVDAEIVIESSTEADESNPSSDEVQKTKDEDKDAFAKIIEGVHTKKGHPIFTVVLGEIHPRDVFDGFKDEARNHGGYYSFYNGRGATRGFIFQSSDEAKSFVAAIQGDQRSVKPITIQSVMDMTDIRPGHSVLAVRTAEMVGPAFPNVSIDVIQKMASEHGRLVKRDFLDFCGNYDRIVIHPPKGEEIPCLAHGIDVLKAKGKMICIYKASFKPVFERFQVEKILPENVTMSYSENEEYFIVVIDK